MSVLIGCSGYPGNPKRYQKELSAVEILETFRSLPKLTTAERWKESAPESFSFIIKAWQLITHRPDSPTYKGLSPKIMKQAKEAGHFGWNASVELGWQKTAEFAQNLGAKAIVFETPMDFTPTKENRERLTTFFNKIERVSECDLVWDPRGLWSEEEKANIAAESNLVICSEDISSEEKIFTKIRHASFGEEDVERLAYDLDEKSGVVLFAVNDAFARAKRLQALLSGL